MGRHSAKNVPRAEFLHPDLVKDRGRGGLIDKTTYGSLD